MSGVRRTAEGEQQKKANNRMGRESTKQMSLLALGVAPEHDEQTNERTRWNKRGNAIPCGEVCKICLPMDIGYVLEWSKYNNREDLKNSI